MRILITGITGFAGGHLAEALLAGGGLELHGTSRSAAWSPCWRNLQGQAILHACDLGDSVLKSSLTLMPILPAAFISSWIAKRMLDRVGPRPVLVIGGVLCVAAFLWLAFIHAHYWLSGMAGHVIKHRLDVPLICTFHTLARVKAETADDEPERRDRAEAHVMRLAALYALLEARYGTR